MNYTSKKTEAMKWQAQSMFEGKDKLDNIDLKIIKSISRDCRVSYRNIA
jgi:hypothetical protein